MLYSSDIPKGWTPGVVQWKIALGKRHGFVGLLRYCFY
jgi:hypothetical protein